MISCMRAPTSSNSGLIGPPSGELAALERLKKSPYAYNWKNDVSTFSRLFLIKSFSYLQVYYIHESLDESNRKAMDRNWSNQRQIPPLKPKREINKYYK